MEATEICARLRALYEAATKARESDPDVLVVPHDDYSSRPPAKRPEAGFSIGFPAADDGAYAAMSIVPSGTGVRTHGQAGRKQPEREDLLFSWPSVEIQEDGYVVEQQHVDTADQAVQRIIDGLRRRLANVHR